MSHRRLRATDLNDCPVRQAAESAAQVLDSLQNHQPRAQLIGIALAFVALVRRTEIHPGDVLTTAERMLRADEKNNPEIAALRSYLDEEVMAHL